MKQVEGWTISDLDALVDIDIESLNETTPQDFAFYYLDIGSVSEGKMSPPSIETLFRDAPSRARKVVHRRDVLMSTVRPNLKAFAYFDLEEAPFVASTGFAVLTAKPGIDPLFILYTILSDSISRQIDTLVSGSNYPAINSSAVRCLKVLTPPKPEQAKIAEVLFVVDQAIKQTEVLITKQQRIKTGLVQDLLTRGIDEQGNIRNENTHIFKDSPLGRIPLDWDVTSISSILAAPPKNGFSPIESNEWNGTYMLGLGCLTPEGFRAKQLKYAPKAAPSIRAAILRPGDFLISRSNTRSLVGLVGIFQDVGAPCIYPDLMVRLIFSSEVLVEYMEQVFLSPLLRQQIENAATGTSGSMVKISAALINSFIFIKPPVDEQRRILSKLKAVVCNLDSNVQSLAKLQALKVGLMQDLLTGKKRVSRLLESDEFIMEQVS